jgi:hypothetical protein
LSATVHLIPFYLVLLFPQGTHVPAGTRLEARLQSSGNTRTSAVGNEVLAVLTKPLVAGGTQVAASGSRLHGRIETISGATQSSTGRVRIVFRELEIPDGRRTAVWVTESYAASGPNRTVRSLLYSGAGGIAGAFIGGRRMRAAGAIGGGLIGFIVAINSSGTKLPDLRLKQGQVLHLRLGEDVVLEPESEPSAKK